MNVYSCNSLLLAVLNERAINIYEKNVMTLQIQKLFILQNVTQFVMHVVNVINTKTKNVNIFK